MFTNDAARVASYNKVQNFKSYIYIKFFVVCFFGPQLLEAQELTQVSIHSNESFYVHTAENVGIFSDLKNSGTFGAYSNSIISFLGQRWSNMQGSRLVDESPNGISGQGGSYKFKSLTNAPQIIENQNIKADHGFPSLTIANAANVRLEGTDLFIKRNLSFENGRLILNDRNAMLALNAIITGFDNNKFVVTGTATNGGFLVRNLSGFQQSDVVFPVGTTPTSYTPASVDYRGVAQNIKVRVFENVYDKAAFGVADNVNTVPKTWNFASTTSDPAAVMTLKTQHNVSEEAVNFAAKRPESFISRFSTSAQQWDNVSPAPMGPAAITSGSAIPNAYMHTRASIAGLGNNEYFSKVVKKTSLIGGLRIPAGISPNNDGLNEKFIIENLQPTDKVKLDIYNRWQILVFRDGNYKNTFDGIGNQKGLVNNELPDGTYYYILNINVEKPITGYIVINR